MKEKILISACFLGEKVRYNGEIKLLKHVLIDRWHTEQRLIPICPEVIGGLSVPRAAAEIHEGKVITCDGLDVTQQFKSGANKALALCQRHNIRFALLKESSPSCGSHSIYDGTFNGVKIVGQGVCTQLLEKNGIKVFSELTIKELASLLSDTKQIDESDLG
jgi:uncharacterized protein YbbK (DUF523 family)